MEKEGEFWHVWFFERAVLYVSVAPLVCHISSVSCCVIRISSCEIKREAYEKNLVGALVSRGTKEVELGRRKETRGERNVCPPKNSCLRGEGESTERGRYSGQQTNTMYNLLLQLFLFIATESPKMEGNHEDHGVK
jgi:hypothetical protein